MKELIVICGPTASGKTKLAINLAKKYNTEIISADSRQFYREMTIGTAKPNQEELCQAKHHFINSLSIHQDYSAGQFEKEGLACLNHLFQKNDKVICVGGSGLYIQALCEGFDDLPDVLPETRKQLQEELEKFGLEKLASELYEKDEFYFKKVNQKNPQRIIRALEIIRTTGKSFSSFRQKNVENRPFKVSKIGIDWDREKLYERINLRVDLMIEEGLEKEVKALYPFKHLNALQTVGYTELFDYFENKISKEEAIRLIKRNSRRYAKRQLTWFRRDETTKWVAPS